MTQFVVLLRGINVGGHNKLSMKDLREILEALGYESVKTYIQSGNVVLSGPATADVDAMQACKGPTEKFTLTDDALYLHAPDGIGRSKFAAAAERLLGVEATGRNLNTVRKLLEMLSST